MAAEIAQTLDRGLRALSLLAAEPRGITMTELARRLGINRTVAYRLVATLQHHQLARRDTEGRVFAGMGVLQLAQGVEPLLRAKASPVLRRLAEDVGATAHLTVREGDEAVAVAVVEPSWTDFHVAYRVGARHALDRGAAGKAIRLGEERSGPEYVVTHGELQPGASGVAAPLLGVSGLAASVGVVALGELDVTVVGDTVVRAAREVAVRLT
ncbi:helix-turn-helix domain-containing protein [soil metagenome]